MTRRMMLVTRVACDEEGDGKGYKSDGDEGDGRATATRVMVTARGRDKLIGIGRNLAGKELRDWNSIVCNSMELQFWD